ncbi:MAG: long-chain fatty acid--CoA ligase [Spirochaetaceae bacterium]|nr:long-chain fatty acid--CoA ligase [Spirochaetaceae bacterium]
MNTPNTLPKRIKASALKHPETSALMSKDQNGDFQNINFKEFYEKIKTLGTGLHKLGVKRNDHVAIISDNCKEWIITDLALLGIGAIDVPSGSDSTADEMQYIIEHADCELIFAENSAQAEKILSRKKDLPKMKKIITFFSDGNIDKKLSEGIEILSFEELEKISADAYAKDGDLYEKELEKGDIEDIATIIYTSGTTGIPKGVMLQHKSYMFQLDNIYEYVNIVAGEILLSVLPVWHSFERLIEYVVLERGAALAYSKPIGAIMLSDMAKVKPQWMASVPRIWEGVRAGIYRNVNKEGGAKKGIFLFFVSVGSAWAHLNNMFKGTLPTFHKRIRTLDIILSIIPLIFITPLKLLGDVLVFSKIKAKLGGRFIAGISGGGALPPYVDSFFQAAGIGLLEGYGLTETGPVVAVRKQNHPVGNTVGPLFPGIEYRVIGKDGALKGPGEKGTLYLKGDMNMKGYYKRQEATDDVLKEGWLNTGDICITTHNKEVSIVGRSKETIVLMGGENIEPVPIEDKINASEAILQNMVVGQDKKFLAALIVPNMELLEEKAEELGISYVPPEDLLSDPEIEEYIHNEIQAQVSPKTGFKPFECVFRFKLMEKPFEVGKELTQTLKLRRSVIDDLYAKEIKSLFK